MYAYKYICLTFIVHFNQLVNDKTWQTLGPYAFLVTTSGAIQYGVPTIVDLLLCSGVIWAQNPKSAAKINILVCKIY